MKSKILAVICLIIASLLVYPVTAQTTSISVEDIQVGVGESKTVPIYVYDVTDSEGVGTVYLDLLYDSSVVQITATDDSDTDFTFVTPNIDNTIGKFSVGGTYIGAAPGPAGDVLVINVTFTAVGSVGEQSLLNITNTLLQDATPQQNDIPHEIDDGNFVIGGIMAPSLVTYTISNRTITPPQTTEIDVEFSEQVEAWIKIEDAGRNLVNELYHSAGVTNPTPKTWDGTYGNGTQVPDGDYYVNVTGFNATTGLSVVNNTEIITVTTVPPIDDLPPVTTYDVAPAPNPAGWNNVVPVNVTFNRVDQGGSGVNYTRWSTTSEEGPWTTEYGEDPFVVQVNTEGETTIWYYSVDLNETANTEAVKNMTVKIDFTDPDIELVILDPTTPAPNGDILVTVNATDALSDVAMVTANGVQLKKQNSPWNGTITAEFLPGTHGVEVVVTDNAGNTATDTAEYTVLEVYGFEFTVDENAKEIVQGETATYTLTVTNTGNTEDTINLTIVSGEGTLSINPEVTVAVGESKDVTLSVNGTDVTDYVTTVNATSQGSEQTASVTVTTTVVAKEYGVTLTPDKTTATITEGQTATYTLTVKNTGNTEDTINLTIVSGPGTLSINPEVTLAAAETKDVTLTVQGNTVGTFATTVNATSQGDANKTASVTVTTTVNKKTVPHVGGGGGYVQLDSDGDGYTDIVETLQQSDPEDPCDPDPNCAACLATKPAPTPTPTATPTVSVPPTPVATPAATSAPSTPTPTPEEPGFGVVFAIAGLLAVAYLVLRRKRE